MARLDCVIHENTCEIKLYVDGPIESGHDKMYLAPHHFF